VSRKADINKYRKSLLGVMVAFLYAVILVFIGCLSYSVYRIRLFDFSEYKGRLVERLSGGQSHLYPIKDKGYLDRERFYRPGKEDVPVYVFGGSSVILASNEDKVFSVILEGSLRKRNPNVRVYNFGRSALDSFGVKRRMEQVFKKQSAPPRLIVFYMGHNDYTNVYKNIFSVVYDRFGWLLRLSYALSHKRFDQSGYFRYRKLKVPVIIKTLQYLRLIRIHDEIYLEINRTILMAFKRNIEEMCRIMADRGIPVIFITPVGNLVAEPYGNIHSVTAYYRQGLAAENYGDFIGNLKKARDSEILTADVRVKSPLNDYLRGLEGGTTHVIDLEGELIRRGSRFDQSIFSDYFHFTDEGHRIVAESIYEGILDDEGLRTALGIPSGRGG